MSVQSEGNGEGFFRQRKQKPQGILDVFPRIFANSGGNKTRRSPTNEQSEVPIKKRPVRSDKPFLELMVRIELTTCSLRVNCSAIEPHQHIFRVNGDYSR